MKFFDEETLLNSETIKKLTALSRVNPINTNNQTEVDGALASALVYLVEAFDKNAIQFDNRDDENAFFQMLFINFQLVAQIRPKSLTHH